MTMAVLDPELRAALEGDRTPKFLATLDANGQPNCVPIISLTPYGDDMLIFGEFFMQKTRRNLLANPRVGITVYTEDFHGWMLKGVFEGFETSGERVDLINQTPMFRYNAYTSIRAAGRIRITEVSKRHVLAPARLYCDFALVTAQAHLHQWTGILARLRGHDPAVRACMPRPVAGKFRRATAIRAAAFLDDDGFPRTFPLIACVPAGPNNLLFRHPLADLCLATVPPNAEIAVAILTREPIAYQVKGRYQGRRAGTHRIGLTACYSASPPLLGERLDTPCPP
jgi:predicted pyridoxine 5'-phosphate oxidase superfamily flavin-nucleotide-binding protein